MYQISNEKFGLFVTELRKEKNLTCVSCCIRVIWEREEEGTSSRHFFRPSGELAYEASCSIILSYSSVFNAF